MRNHHDVLVVGTGPAGTQVALGLAAGGFAGSIGLVGAEPELPYERPPLSKGYLTGDCGEDALLTRPATFWSDSPVDLRLGAAVTSVNPAAHRVRTAENKVMSYGSLVWAAGCRPRRLEVAGAELDGVLALRSWQDAKNLRESLGRADRVAVIGGGYIGLEVAAAATKLGARVTVVEAQERLLARVAGHTVAEYVAQRHVAAGVRLKVGTGVTEILGDGSSVVGVRLSSGEIVDADIVVVGVGVVPNVEPLAAAGATCRNGVVVDEGCRTDLPDVLAAGDCAVLGDPGSSANGLRIESIQNASAHAKMVVATLMGHPRPARETPWFWSNQYDLKLKTAGLTVQYDNVVLRGEPDSGQFAVVYLRGDVVVAVDAMNSARDFAHGKALVGVNVRGLQDMVADTAVPLKLVLSSAHEGGA